MVPSPSAIAASGAAGASSLSLSSSWRHRLESKFAGLTEASSKESFQTHARWLLFNRRHMNVHFVPVMQDLLQQRRTTRQQFVILAVLQELLQAERSHTAKWDRYAAIRIDVGEALLLQAVSKGWLMLNVESIVNKCRSLLESCDEANSFGGPTLIGQIQKQLNTAVAAMSTSATDKADPQTTKAMAAQAVSEEIMSTPIAQGSPSIDKGLVITEKSMTPVAVAANKLVEASSSPTQNQAIKTQHDKTPSSSTLMEGKDHDKGENGQDSVAETQSKVDADSIQLDRDSAEVAAALNAERQEIEDFPMPDAGDGTEPNHSDVTDAITDTLKSTTNGDERSASPRNADKPHLTNEESGAVSTESNKKGSAIDSKDGATSASSNNKDIAYDFESKGIPYAKVEAREFADPCRAIATLQIARDLRSDGAVQLASLLSALPAEVRAVCAQADEQASAATGDPTAPFEISEAMASEFSLRVNETLIDMDVEEQLQNIRTFRELVQRQRQARTQLMLLLIRSRCRFGADEAAQAFLDADRAQDELKRRQQVLADAMELEGLDFFELITGNSKDDSKSKSIEQENQELPPLTWYQPKLPSNKRDHASSENLDEIDTARATTKRPRADN